MTSHNASGRFSPPKISEVAWAPLATNATKRTEFNKYVEKLNLYLNMINLDKKFPCTWTTVINDQQRQSHDSFPLKGAPTEAKKRVHHDAQNILMHALTEGLSNMPRFDALHSQNTISMYTTQDPINGEPYPAATMLFAALSQQYSPTTLAAVMRAQTSQDARIATMPPFRQDNYDALPAWIDIFQMEYKQLQALDTTGHNILNEKAVMEKLKNKLFVNAMQPGSISITKLETAWSMQPPTTLDEICSTMQTFCEGIINMLLPLFPVPQLAAVVNYVPPPFSAPQPAAVVNYVPPPFAPTPPLPSDNVDKPCQMCDSDRHETYQCRAFQQAKSQLKKERLEGRSPGTNFNRPGNNNNRRGSGKGGYNNNRGGHGARHNDRAPPPRNDNWRNRNNKRPAEENVDRPRHHNSRGDDTRQLRFRHESPNAAPSDRAGGSSFRNVHATAPFSAAATLHNDIFLHQEQPSRIEFTGHVFTDAKMQDVEVQMPMIIKDIFMPAPCSPPLDFLPETERYSPTSPEYDKSPASSPPTSPEAILCISRTPSPFPGFNTGLQDCLQGDSTGKDVMEAIEINTPDQVVNQEEIAEALKEATALNEEILAIAKDVDAPPGNAGQATAWATFASLDKNKNDMRDLCRLKKRANLPADLDDVAHEAFLAAMPGTPVTISNEGLRNFLALLEKEKGPAPQPATNSLGINTISSIAYPYTMSPALSETNLCFEPPQTLNSDQHAALKPPTAPDIAALLQPSRTVVTIEPPRPCEKTAPASHKLSAACNMPQFLNKSVPQPPNSCVLCFGILPPQPSSNSAPFPLYKSDIPRKAYTQPPNNTTPQLTHHLLVDSGTSKHILNSQDLVLNATDHHQAVAGFAGNYSRSTHKGDLGITLLTSNNELIDLVDKNNALVIPDARANLLSVICLQEQGHTIILGKTPGLLFQSNPKLFTPFSRCEVTNLWILNIRAHRCKNNNVYALHNTETDITNADLLDTHRQLGHPSFKRMRDLKLASDEPTKPAKKRRTSHAPPSCPTCVTAKMRRSAAPAPSSPDTRATGPWETVYIDLSGKVRARCFSNVSYFVVFICDYSGAKYLDFLKQKSDFFLAYKRFITHTQHHPRKIHTDRGGEFRSLEFSTYLEENHTNHVMCAPDEHFSIGCAENAIHTIREKAKCLLLDSNTPKRFWNFAIGHACYLSNLTSRSRADPKLTIYELLFQQKADLSKIPPFGCFASSYKNRRLLTDQSFDLTSKPGIFLGINRYDKCLGYCMTDMKVVWITRNHIAFDKRYFPLKMSPNAASPQWQTFHHLATNSINDSIKHADSQAAVDEGDPLEFEIEIDDDSVPTQPQSSLPLAVPQASAAAAESPVTPATSKPPSNINTNLPAPPPLTSTPSTAETPTNPTSHAPPAPLAQSANQDSSSSEDDTNDLELPDQQLSISSVRPSRRAAADPPPYFKHRRPPKPPSTAETRYNSDATYKAERDSLVGKPVNKFFPMTAKLHAGNVTQYHCSTDTYTIVYDDDDFEVMTFDKLQFILPSSPLYNQAALHSALVFALHTANIDASNCVKQLYSEPLTHKEATRAPDAAEWLAAQDLEMDNLRNLNCWEVIDINSIPSGAPIMKSKWVYKYKLDANGNLKKHRARIVAKGFTQIENVNYFETFAPVAHSSTIRLILSLTSKPDFQAYQFDVSVAFIEAPLDANEPNIYCQPPPGYENPKKYVYLLRKHLYGMKQSGRGWILLLRDILESFNLTRLKTDESIWTLRIPNLPDPTTNIRPYSDCPSTEALLILISYVDDLLVLSNCPSLVTDLEEHCNKRVKINNEGPAHWYLNVRYQRDPITGAVSASQELYINKLLREYGLEKCNSIPVPFPATGDIILKQLALPPINPSPSLTKAYQKLIGSLLYLQTHTVPEISYALSVLSRYLQNPGDLHMHYARKILRYLQGRKTIPLTYCAASTRAPHLAGQIYGYSDASFADVLPLRQSTIGYAFTCNGGTISWRSTRSPLVALNTCEAELISMSAACQEAIYLRKVANELGFLQSHPTTLYQDNTAAAALSRDVRFRNRSKHINLRWCYVAERQLLRDVDVVSISRNIMLADIFASPRSAQAFIPFRNELLNYFPPATATPPNPPAFCLHIQEINPAPYTCYFLEGNIGVGKSTVLRALAAINDPRICIIQEPVHEWIHLLGHVQNGTLDPALFQIIVLNSISTALAEAFARHSPATTFIVERSIQSNQNVFAALSLQQNTPAHDAYLLALDYAHRILPTNIHPHFLYLRAPPAICFSRILQRARPEESEISLAYLTQLHDLHDAWLKEIPNSTFINASQHSDFVAQDVLKIIEPAIGNTSP